jgi:tetratricopeptide (TPR) repeat protein
VTINDRTYTKLECLREALKLDPNDFRIWSNIATALEGDETFELDGVTDNAQAVGANLGSGETIVVNGQRMTKRDCLLRALEINPQDYRVWNNIANSFLNDQETMQFQGRSYTRRECQLQSLTLHEDNDAVWNNMGADMGPNDTVQIKGVVYTKMQCLARALRLEPNDFRIWNNVANGLRDGESFQFEGQSFTKRDCLMKAAQGGTGRRAAASAA